MKSRFFRRAIVFPVIFLFPLTIGLGSCASKPAAPERPESEKIQKDSDKGMQDLEKEEDRRGSGGY